MIQIKNFMDWESPGIALITGASSGIGAAFARELASQKFNLVLVARRKEKLEQIASELEDQHAISAHILVTDLSKLDEIKRVYEYITKLDEIDILINNAGFGTLGYFDNTPLEPNIDMIFVHNIASTYFCRATLPIMIKSGRGVIINVASLAVIVQLPHNAIYNATKSFLRSFTETLHMELEDTCVKVQCLCPGFTSTEFHEVGDFEGFDRSLIPESSWMTPEEVVKLSLKAVPENEVVFIPGEAKQAFAKLWANPKLGARTRRNMIKLFKLPRKK